MFLLGNRKTKQRNLTEVREKTRKTVLTIINIAKAWSAHRLFAPAQVTLTFFSQAHPYL